MQSVMIKFPTIGALFSFNPHIIPINCPIGKTLVGTLMLFMLIAISTSLSVVTSKLYAPVNHTQFQDFWLGRGFQGPHPSVGNPAVFQGHHVSNL